VPSDGDFIVVVVVVVVAATPLCLQGGGTQLFSVVKAATVASLDEWQPFSPILEFKSAKIK
jgi:hypothetical protein